MTRESQSSTLKGDGLFTTPPGSRNNFTLHGVGFLPTKSGGLQKP